MKTYSPGKQYGEKDAEKLESWCKYERRGSGSGTEGRKRTFFLAVEISDGQPYLDRNFTIDHSKLR